MSVMSVWLLLLQQKLFYNWSTSVLNDDTDLQQLFLFQTQNIFVSHPPLRPRTYPHLDPPTSSCLVKLINIQADGGRYWTKSFYLFSATHNYRNNVRARPAGLLSMTGESNTYIASDTEKEEIWMLLYCILGSKISDFVMILLIM